MFWDRSQIAIVSAFDKEYILYCVNIAFGHDPKNHLSKFLRFCLGTIPNDHLGPIQRIIQSCFRARSQNFPRELFKLVWASCPSWISGREKMTVENISWLISTKECCRPRRGLNPRPPGLQSDGASNWATEAGNKHYVLRIYPYFCFRTLSWVNINGFSPNSVWTLIL